MDFKTIYITLGSNCNFKCSYCMQRYGIQREICNSESFDKIKFFIENSNVEKIMLWGGEPLLYWGKILKLVPYIYSVKPDCRINMITNGSLLTEDKVSFINEYNIGVGLSHDGEKTVFTRGKDVLEDQNIMTLFKQIKSKGICCVISAVNQDIYDIWAYYDKLFPEGITVNFDMLKDFHDIKFLNFFDYEKFNETVRNIASGFAEAAYREDFEAREYHFFNNHVEILNNILKKDKRTFHLKCGVMSSAVNIDFSGNILLCKNSDIIIGHVDDILSAKENFKTYIKVPEICTGCRFYTICDPAGCVIENAEMKMRSCKLNTIVYNAFFEGIGIWQKKMMNLA
ncbi:radical SAM protein [uncultured Phascolarctobacterium sp.]|uniref:radical SAM protein n=1 Tax=Phascolarctobacterium sp. TaxID=2049039 RepID=UPI0025EFFD5F|nr:radical SAM protein [uncultured Phascolarctobacterium sp.]